jgi:hypothetical protein
MQSAKQAFKVKLSLCQLFGVESKISLKYYNENNFLSFLKVLVLFIRTKSTFDFLISTITCQPKRIVAVKPLKNVKWYKCI